MTRDLERLTSREHDLIVVGGGIYGAAAAWDAAQRGLQVALVEAADFGAGVSSNSLKTIHGGLRYLQRLDLVRMRESIRERRALLRIAPRLVRPLPFLVPTYGHGAKGRVALRVAMLANDAVAWDRNRGLPEPQRIPPGRMLSPREVLALVPGLEARGLSGGAVFCDAQALSSERLLLGFLHAAVAHGAALANHLEAVSLLRAGGRAAGVRARDHEAGADLEVRGRVVLNAAGPGMLRLLEAAGIRRPRVPLLRAFNLVLSRPVVQSHAVGGLGRDRYLFLVPWNGVAIVGTAYEDPSRDLADAARAFLAEAQAAYPQAELTPRDVALVHRGLVPGTGGARGLATRPLLIDHEAEDGVAGLVSVLGVKYTTARGVAERAVDLVFRRLGRTPPPCRTAVTELEQARLLEGSLARRTLEAVRDEMALHLADAVLRRLDLATAGPPAPADLEVVAGTMAAELGWSAERVAAERDALAVALGPRLE